MWESGNVPKGAIQLKQDLLDLINTKYKDIFANCEGEGLSKLIHLIENLQELDHSLSYSDAAEIMTNQQQITLLEEKCNQLEQENQTLRSQLLQQTDPSTQYATLLRDYNTLLETFNTSKDNFKNWQQRHKQLEASFQDLKYQNTTLMKSLERSSYAPPAAAGKLVKKSSYQPGGEDRRMLKYGMTQHRLNMIGCVSDYIRNNYAARRQQRHEGFAIPNQKDDCFDSLRELYQQLYSVEITPTDFAQKVQHLKSPDGYPPQQLENLKKEIAGVLKQRDNTANTDNPFEVWSKSKGALIDLIALQLEQGAERSFVIPLGGDVKKYHKDMKQKIEKIFKEHDSFTARCKI